MLFKLILIPAQYSVWLAEWTELATVQIMDNIANLEAGCLDELLGQGAYAAPAAQAALNCTVLRQSSDLALRALKSPGGRTKGLFLCIHSATASRNVHNI